MPDGTPHTLHRECQVECKMECQIKCQMTCQGRDRPKQSNCCCSCFKRRDAGLLVWVCFEYALVPFQIWQTIHLLERVRQENSTVVLIWKAIWISSGWCFKLGYWAIHQSKLVMQICWVKLRQNRLLLSQSAGFQKIELVEYKLD